MFRDEYRVPRDGQVSSRIRRTPPGVPTCAARLSCSKHGPPQQSRGCRVPGVTPCDFAVRTSLEVQLIHARSRGILQRVSARSASHPRRQVEVVHPPNFIERSRRQLERAEVFTSDWGDIHRPG